VSNAQRVARALMLIGCAERLAMTCPSGLGLAHELLRGTWRDELPPSRSATRVSQADQTLNELVLTD
jgi:hypothetical protein